MERRTNMTPEEALQQYHLDKAEREKQQQQIQQQLQTEKAKRETYYADLKAKKHPTKTRKSHICSNCGETIPKNLGWLIDVILAAFLIGLVWYAMAKPISNKRKK